MPQKEYTPRGWTEDPGEDYEVRLRSQDIRGISFQFLFEIVTDSIFRTTFTSPQHVLPPYPSCQKPLRKSLDIQTKRKSPTSKTIIINGTLVLNLEWTDTPVLSVMLGNTVLHSDLPFRSYSADGLGIAHYTAYNSGFLHAGLGEKASPFDLSGRSFRLATSDTFGYDAERSDPLYKHIPCVITAGPPGAMVQFSSSHSRGFVSIGGEIDGLWGRYKVLRQDYGGLEEYLVVGSNLAQVVTGYSNLVGKPPLVPRWALGYIAGGMKYSMLDDPPASEALSRFADKLAAEDIPCSAFQLSSGYTVSQYPPKTRNVFTWNKHRFPDPEAFVANFSGRGIRILANIKPYVLKNHPEYGKLKESGALFTDPSTHDTAETRLWSAGGGESGVGSHIDFTSEAGFRWWYNGVQSLRKLGIEGIWNDNNEYTIPDDEWLCKLDVKALQATTSDASIGLVGRALHTELMACSSYKAVCDLYPNLRPFVLTRSATAGTMRYACSSWSGDNVTSWASMKASIALSLNAGMSLLPCYGHDIGGFEGPQPSPQLFVRWVQLGTFSPRFAINCFKTSSADNLVGDVIEPWMYPQVTQFIREAIQRRYQLIPYLYSLLLESHITGAPPQRWVGWGYESDEVVWTDKLRRGDTQYWLGDSLLIVGIFEEDAKGVEVYLPRTVHDQDYGFLLLSPIPQHFLSGWHHIPISFPEHIPVFAKVGSIVPIGAPIPTRSSGENHLIHASPSSALSLDSNRSVLIIPAKESSTSFLTTWYEDDGISISDAGISKFTMSMTCTSTEIHITYKEKLLGGFTPSWEKLSILVPKGEKRRISFNSEHHDVEPVDELGGWAVKVTEIGLVRPKAS